MKVSAHMSTCPAWNYSASDLFFVFLFLFCFFPPLTTDIHHDGTPSSLTARWIWVQASSVAQRNSHSSSCLPFLPSGGN